MLLTECFAFGAVPAGCLLNSGNQVAGKTLGLVVTFIKRIPAEIAFTRRPVGNKRGFAVPSRASNQNESVILCTRQFG